MYLLALKQLDFVITPTTDDHSSGVPQDGIAKVILQRKITDKDADAAAAAVSGLLRVVEFQFRFVLRVHCG